MFPHHLTVNPFGPHAPQPTPPEACDVPLARLHAAQRVGGECLSADGMVVYTVRYGRVLQAEWKGNDWGAWLDVGEVMPAGAVRM